MATKYLKTNGFIKDDNIVTDCICNSNCYNVSALFSQVLLTKFISVIDNINKYFNISEVFNKCFAFSINVRAFIIAFLFESSIESNIKY